MNRVAAAVETALAATPLPGVVVMAADAEWVLHVSAHGAYRPDTMFRIFSMTKLVGVLTALKAVEEGAFAWEDAVGGLLPEFDDLPVLDGFEGGAPRLRPQRRRATFADLAAHTSGAAYAEWRQPLADYARHVGEIRFDDHSLEGLKGLPLAFDPGAGWGYGTGIDWLCLAVQRATGERLERYVPDRLFAPLGLTNLCFEADAAQRARLAPGMRLRDGALKPLERSFPPAPEFYGMGSALFGDAADYIRLLRMILRGGEGVLSAESVASLFVPRTGPLAPMKSASPGATADVDLFPGQPLRFARGGLLTEVDAPGRRRAGSIGWAGMWNTHFWLDPAAGLAGVVMMQHLPFCEPHALAVYDAFERAVYAEPG